MSRLRVALGELEAQLVSVFSTARRNEAGLRAELNVARLNAAKEPGAVSLFEAGSRRAETSLAVFVQLQRFIGMQQVGRSVGRLVNWLIGSLIAID